MDGRSVPLLKCRRRHQRQHPSCTINYCHHRNQQSSDTRLIRPSARPDQTRLTRSVGGARPSRELLRPAAVLPHTARRDQPRPTEFCRRSLTEQTEARQGDGRSIVRLVGRMQHVCAWHSQSPSVARHGAEVATSSGRTLIQTAPSVALRSHA